MDGCAHCDKRTTYRPINTTRPSYQQLLSQRNMVWTRGGALKQNITGRLWWYTAGAYYSLSSAPSIQCCVSRDTFYYINGTNSFILLFSCTEAAFSLSHTPILHYLDYLKFFLEQHVHLLCICGETNNLRCITVNCRVPIFIAQQNMRMSICGVIIDCLFTGWKQIETVWILKQHPVSLLILSNCSAVQQSSINSSISSR